jgi:parvulin-like peptidyl-prolyl isomerase
MNRQTPSQRLKNLGALLVVLLCIPSLASAEKVIEQIVAHVGEQVILLSDVQARLVRMDKMSQFDNLSRPEKENACLESLIDERLVAQEVQRLNIDVSSEEVEGVVERMRTQNRMNEFQFEQALMSQGMNLLQYREQIKKQLIKMRLVQTKVKNQVQIADEDIRALYLQRTRDQEGSFELKASHILIKLAPGASEDEVAAAQEKLKQAQKALLQLTFAEAAQKYSEGPSGPSGGGLGVFGRGQMVPAFEKAAFEAPVGEVVGPVRTAFGFHLIWVQERVASVVPSYESVLPALRQELTDREMERLFYNYIKGLRQKSWISKTADLKK